MQDWLLWFSILFVCAWPKNHLCYLRQMMIIYEGVEFESPEEMLLGNPSVNYTKQIEQKYIVLLYRYPFIIKFQITLRFEWKISLFFLCISMIVETSRCSCFNKKVKCQSIQNNVISMPKTVFIIFINGRSNLIHTNAKLAQKRICNRFCWLIWYCLTKEFLWGIIFKYLF